MSADGLVTITVPTSGGAGTIPTVDYSAELAKVQEQVAKLTATMVSINLSLTGIAASVAGLESFLVAVQVPSTGDFRTKDVSVTTDNVLVNTALTKSGIVSPVNGGL
jgi:hypothetical protein